MAATGSAPAENPDFLRSSTDRSLTFAEKLDRCFRTMHPAGRGPWTYKEVSAGISALGKTDADFQGVTCSPSYLWQLRTGAKTNPSMRQVEALAKWFRVPPSYFVGTSEEVSSFEAQLGLLEALRNPEVVDIALRASRLSAEGISAVAGVVSSLEAVPGMSPSRPTRNGRKQTETGPVA